MGKGSREAMAVETLSKLGHRRLKSWLAKVSRPKLGIETAELPVLTALRGMMDTGSLERTLGSWRSKTPSLNFLEVLSDARGTIQHDDVGLLNHLVEWCLCNEFILL